MLLYCTVHTVNVTTLGHFKECHWHSIAMLIIIIMIKVQLDYCPLLINGMIIFNAVHV